MNYSVLIIGHGYVGKAVHATFNKDSVDIIDPKFTKLNMSDVRHKKYDIVFVCVDTPIKENFKTLNSVLSGANKFLKKGTLVCCKSTALPEFYYRCQKKYTNINVVFSPEYLSHWNNIDDFANQSFIIAGGEKKYAKKAANILSSRLKFVKKIKITDIKTAALTKYAVNAFLSLKVTFANDLYNISKRLKCKSFEELADLFGTDIRIGHSHLQVPGRDGKFGWGGHCYEKDNQEFAKFTRSKLLKTMIAVNKIHRKQT
jgi:UDPglucose 6-dehydrogenase